MTTPDIGHWYREHAEAVRRYLLRRCGGDRQLADDLTHDTFVRAMRASYVDQGKPLAWLYTIAARLLVDHWRSHASRTVPVAAVYEDVTPIGRTGYDGDDPVDASAVDEQRRVLVAAVRRLTEEAQAQAVTMHHLRGLTLAETADELGVSANQIKARCHRATGRLAADPAVAALREVGS